MTGTQPSSLQRFLGMLLVTLGGLLFALSGACTGLGVIAGIMTPGGGLEIVGLALAIGVLPILAGFGLFRWGVRLMRPGPAP